MKLEKQIEFEARDDAEAIQIARERLGREAVILSSRPVKRGGIMGFFSRQVLWVSAGLIEPDTEEVTKESRDRLAAFQHLLEVRKAVSGIYGGDASRGKGSEIVPNVSQAAMASQASAAYSSVAQANINAQPVLTKQVDEIRDILSKVLVRLDSEKDGMAESFSHEENLSDLNLSALLRAEVDGDIARELVSEYKQGTRKISFRTWLGDQIDVVGTDPWKALGGNRVLFVGPTGVGKTTTIAKIASVHALWEGRKVVLLTADTYRIAAVEQLRTYAKILGVPMEIIFEPQELDAAIKKHEDADLLLLDTAGRSHKDEKRMEELRSLYTAFEPDAVNLVIAANIKYRDMLDVIDRMGVIPLSALLFTKLDETRGYGPLLNILHDFKLPLSFWTMGQNVPNDIEVAQGDRFARLLLEDNLVGER